MSGTTPKLIDVSALLAPPMLRHRLSVHKDETNQRNAAFVDGICHALDVLAETEGQDAADRLMGRLFVTPDGRPALKARADSPDGGAS